MNKRKRDNRQGSRYEMLIRGLIVLILVLTSVLLVLNIVVPGMNTEQEAFSEMTDADGADGIACNDGALERLTAAVERGGTVDFVCNGVLRLTETLVINTDLTINGSSDHLTTITGDDLLETLFKVSSGAQLTLKNVHLMDSTRYGVYVEPGANLQAINARFSGHGSDSGDGAGIWNRNGYVRVEQTIFDDNHSYDDAAAIFNWKDGLVEVISSTFRNNSSGEERDGSGAAIRNHGQISIVDSRFIENMSVNGSGGAISSMEGVITIENSTFSQNTAAGSGAAILNQENADMTIRDSVFTDNRADSGSALSNSGSLSLSDVSITGSGSQCENTGTLTDPDNACNIP